MMPFYLPQFKKKFVGNVKSLRFVRKMTAILRKKEGEKVQKKRSAIREN